MRAIVYVFLTNLPKNSLLKAFSWNMIAELELLTFNTLLQDL